MKSINRFAVAFLATLLATTLGGIVTANEEGTQYSAAATAGSGNSRDDAAINAEVKDQIFREPSLQASGIIVETANGVVRLSGFANSQEKILTAVQTANSVQGVVSVQNDVQVK
jgi:osmotically-inducible protein OsmY